MNQNQLGILVGALGAVIVIGLLALIAIPAPSKAPGTASSTPVVTAPPSSTTTPPAPPPYAEKGTVKGVVTLGPTCPVERIPPDPNCADKPYQTSIRIQPANPSAPSMTISTDARGAFSVSLDSGSYTFHPVGGNSRPPTCRDSQVTVTTGETKILNLDCDSGIR